METALHTIGLVILVTTPALCIIPEYLEYRDARRRRHSEPKD